MFQEIAEERENHAIHKYPGGIEGSAHNIVPAVQQKLRTGEEYVEHRVNGQKVQKFLVGKALGKLLQHGQADQYRDIQIEEPVGIVPLIPIAGIQCGQKLRKMEFFIPTVYTDQIIEERPDQQNETEMQYLMYPELLQRPGFPIQQQSAGNHQKQGNGHGAEYRYGLIKPEKNTAGVLQGVKEHPSELGVVEYHKKCGKNPHELEINSFSVLHILSLPTFYLVFILSIVS